ncbi:unnamed protein product [Calypogeia fissa]
MQSNQIVELILSTAGDHPASELNEGEKLKQNTKRYYHHDTYEAALLPGIPNRITLNHIITKLPWKTLYILPSLSRGWRQAIRSHQVHDARVRSKSAETLIVANYIQTKDVHAISLYSMGEKVSYRLPAIPGFGEGYPGRCPRSCQSVWLDGKIYVLGGVDDSGSSNEVYVLDLAGQRGWRHCSSMLEPRQKFGCGVMDGKIYVFGGICLGRPVFGSEVYNPKVDTWSSIEPMEMVRYDHHVTSLGEKKKFLVQGGKFFDPELIDEWITGPDKSNNEGLKFSAHADFLDEYSPERDEWESFHLPSAMDTFETGVDRILVAPGKHYWVTRLGILVREKGEDSWRHLHSFSFPQFGPKKRVAVWPSAIMALGDELLAIAHWRDKDGVAAGACLVQSKGLGSENEEIVWWKARLPLWDHGDDWLSSLRYFMYPIEL